MRKLNILNQRFGKLVAIEPRHVARKLGWVCHCDCGRTKWYQTYQLSQGVVKGCGSCRDEDITGKKFGRLTVISRSGYDSKCRRHRWLCSCVCGKNIETYVRYLQRGTRTDCGCMDEDRRKNKGLKQIKENKAVIWNGIATDYKTNARRRNLQFNLSVDEVRLLVSSNCYYCGSPPSLIETAKNQKKETIVRNGIDRLVNSDGYTKENSVPCCKLCNYRKREDDRDRFVQWVIRVYNNLKRSYPDKTPE